MSETMTFDLPKFPVPVVNRIVRLVNVHGVRVRNVDGQHILLYNGQQGTKPFKLSASRPAEQSVRYLDRWAETNVKGWRADG